MRRGCLSCGSNRHESGDLFFGRRIFRRHRATVSGSRDDNNLFAADKTLVVIVIFFIVVAIVAIAVYIRALNRPLRQPQAV